MRDVTQPVRLGLEHPRTELKLPENFEQLSLAVVVEADERDAGGVSLRRERDDSLDEPLPVPHADDVSRLRRVAGDRVGTEDRRSWRALENAMGLKKA